MEIILLFALVVLCGFIALGGGINISLNSTVNIDKRQDCDNTKK